jgi:hypothetical protein
MELNDRKPDGEGTTKPEDPLSLDRRDGAPSPSPASESKPANRLPDPSVCRACLGATAHRLSQPITALRGGMELGLRDWRYVADYRQLLEQSMGLVDQMAQSIISLRDLGESRAPSGPAQEIGLEPMVKEVIAELDGLATLRHLRLEVQSDGLTKAYANPERLRQSLQSVLAWAIHNAVGEGIITAKVGTSEGDAQLVISSVSVTWRPLLLDKTQDEEPPGVLFSHAAKHGAMEWVINGALLKTLGGRLDLPVEGPDARSIRARFPSKPGS